MANEGEGRDCECSVFGHSQRRRSKPQGESLRQKDLGRTQLWRVPAPSDRRRSWNAGHPRGNFSSAFLRECRQLSGRRTERKACSERSAASLALFFYVPVMEMMVQESAGRIPNGRKAGELVDPIEKNSASSLVRDVRGENRRFRRVGAAGSIRRHCQGA